MAVALAVLSRLGECENDRAAPLKQCLGSLPYQILFFAIAFFAVSEALSEHLPSEKILGFVTERGLWWNSLLSMLGTGLLVNTINDLPAAAMTGKVLEEASALGALDSRVMTQSVLAALNIDCYVTPIGALAGIIWFHIMRSDGGDVETPTKLGMLTYGLLHFTFVVAALSILIPFANLTAEWLTRANFAPDPQTEAIFWIGGFAALTVFLLTYMILRNHQVRLLDMRAFLTAASWVNVRAQHTGLAFRLIIGLLVIAVFMWIIWQTEGISSVESGSIRPLGDFIVWNIMFLGSGFEGEWFPDKPIARIVAGVMPILAIFLIVRTMQAVRDTSSLRDTSRRVAMGEIVTRRSVVLDYRHWMRPFIQSVWKSPGNRIFQTVLYDDCAPPSQWSTEADYDDVYADKVSFDNYDDIGFVVEDYRLERADEVYLLGEVFQGPSGRPRVREVIRGLWEALNGLDSTDEAKIPGGSVNFGAANRLNSILAGDEPEDAAGRMPRIFIWDDADPWNDPGLEMGAIGPELRRLVIHLPVQWLKYLGSESTRHKLAKRLKDAIAETASDRSWARRRKAIEQKIAED